MVLKSIGCAAGSWATAGAAEGGGGVDMDADCGWAGSVLRGAVDAACGWVGSLATGAGEDGARLDRVVVIVGRGSDDAQRRIIRLLL